MQPTHHPPKKEKSSKKYVIEGNVIRFFFNFLTWLLENFKLHIWLAFVTHTMFLWLIPGLDHSHVMFLAETSHFLFPQTQNLPSMIKWDLILEPCSYLSTRKWAPSFKFHQHLASDSAHSILTLLPGCTLLENKVCVYFYGCLWPVKPPSWSSSKASVNFYYTPK